MNPSWGERYDLRAKTEEFIFGLGKKKKAEVEVSSPGGDGGGNPYHEASGPNGGRFTEGPSGGGSSLEGKSEEDRWKHTKKEFREALDKSGAKIARGDTASLNRQVEAIDAAGYKLLNIMDDAKRAAKIQELVDQFNGKEPAAKAEAAAVAIDKERTTPASGGYGAVLSGRAIKIKTGVGAHREATESEIKSELDLIQQKGGEAQKSSWTHSQGSLDKARVEAEVRARKLMEGTIATKKDVKEGIDEFYRNEAAAFWGLLGLGLTIKWFHDRN